MVGTSGVCSWRLRCPRPVPCAGQGRLEAFWRLAGAALADTKKRRPLGRRLRSGAGVVAEANLRRAQRIRDSGIRQAAR
jgi:hypothetical protein